MALGTCFLDLVGGPESESMLGFLALNPRISLVRHEPLPYPHPEREKTTEDVTDIHMAFASVLPKKQPKLQLKKDLEVIKDALKDLRFTLDPVLTDATPDDLTQKLTKGRRKYERQDGKPVSTTAGKRRQTGCGFVCRGSRNVLFPETACCRSIQQPT